MLQTILLCFFALSTIVLAGVCLQMWRRLRIVENHDDAGHDAAIPAVSAAFSSVDDMLQGSSAADADEEPAAAGDAQARASILVVEDDDVVRQFLVQKLSQSFDVAEAADGGEGLDKAREANPDIVVSDVMMPVMNGYELCHRLRESVETSHIAIILVSALTERENIIYGLEAGADDYVTKPFDMAVLLTRINTILKRRQAYRDSAASVGYVNRDDYKSQLDRDFMERAMSVIERRSPDSDFTINDLCDELGMSRSSVYNKIKSLTGKGPNDIIKIVRLNKARGLLASRQYNVGEVAFMVGFSDPKYFSTCFKKQFGVSPNKI